jgi:prepilin-type processing-associated H-X9-DG protein
MSCTNNLKQVGIALHNYHDIHATLPMGYSYVPGYTRGGFGWGAAILPGLEQRPLFDAANFDWPAWSIENVTVCVTSISFYLCPSDETSAQGQLDRDGFRFAMGSYVASFGPGDMDFGDPEDRRGLFSRNSRTRFASIKDGLSQTLAASERHNGQFGVLSSGGHLFAETVWVGAIREEPDDDHGHTTLFQAGHPPTSPEMDDRDAASRHPGGTNFLFGDGSVKMLKETIRIEVYRALSTRAGGEAISADGY